MTNKKVAILTTVCFLAGMLLAKSLTAFIVGEYGFLVPLAVIIVFAWIVYKSRRASR